MTIGSTVSLVAKLGHFIVSDLYTASNTVFPYMWRFLSWSYLLCHWPPGLHSIATLLCKLWFSKNFYLRSMSSLNFLVSFLGLPRILWVPWNSVHIVKWVFIFESRWYLDIKIKLYIIWVDVDIISPLHLTLRKRRLVSTYLCLLYIPSTMVNYKSFFPCLMTSMHLLYCQWNYFL